jgi:hypothetical protein
MHTIDLSLTLVFSDIQTPCAEQHRYDVGFHKNKTPQVIRETYGVFLRYHIFSHPDSTVGYGITPYHAKGSQTILPVGNLTLPRRFILFVDLSTVLY